MLKGVAGAASLGIPLGANLGWAPGAFAADKKVTVGMAWPGMQDAVWSLSRKLLEEMAAKSNPPIELVFTAADMDVAKQSSDVKDLISKGVDVILVFPIDSKAISASVKEAHDAKIPVMAFLRQVHADAKYQADVFVGIDAKWQEYSFSQDRLRENEKEQRPDQRRPMGQRGSAGRELQAEGSRVAGGGGGGQRKDPAGSARQIGIRSRRRPS